VSPTMIEDMVTGALNRDEPADLPIWVRKD
jgi:hypothetical protein